MRPRFWHKKYPHPQKADNLVVSPQVVRKLISKERRIGSETLADNKGGEVRKIGREIKLTHPPP